MGAMRWIFIAVLVAGFFCAASSLRGLLRKQFAELGRAGRIRWRGLVKDWSPGMGNALLWFAMLILGAVIYLVVTLVLGHWTPSPAVLLGLSIAVVPWFLPRRLLPGWLMLVFAAALWLVGVKLGGSWSWWKIGFVYGTQKHPEIQLGEASLSNLSSILGERYGWQLHDHVTTWSLPFLGTLDVDIQQFCGWIFFASVLMCTVAARRAVFDRAGRAVGVVHDAADADDGAVYGFAGCDRIITDWHFRGDEFVAVSADGAGVRDAGESDDVAESEHVADCAVDHAADASGAGMGNDAGGGDVFGFGDDSIAAARGSD